MNQNERNSLIGNSAFSRTMDDYNAALQGAMLSRNTFNLYMGLCLLWGFAINALICMFFSNQIIALASTHAIMFVIGYLVLAIAGGIIANTSDSPTVSFIGYNMIVLPLGAAVCLIVSYYPVITVGAAFFATTIVTAAMMVVSTLKSDFFLKLGGALFVALIACIVAEVVLMLLGVNLAIFDWIIALLFCGYIGFDWARSQRVPPTLDNAVDCSCSLYLDIINLFIRILSIMGRRN